MERLLVKVVLRVAGRITQTGSIALEKVPSASRETAPIGRKGAHDGHAILPTVVLTKGLEEATTVRSELIREKASASFDVVTLGTSL